MSRTDTWMPLYIGDYLADTMHLDAREHGAYLLLLMHYWRTGPLPDDDRALAAIARVERRVWVARVGPVVRRFFELRDGSLHQKRLELERKSALLNSDVKRAAAHTRWEAEKRRKTAKVDPESGGQGDAYALQEQSTCNAHALHVDGVCICPSPSPSSLRSEDSEAAPLAPAPPSRAHPHDARTLLWREGIPILRSLTGRGDKASRTAIGMWLRDLRDDCPGMLRILQDAAAAAPADPLAWINRAVAGRSKPINGGKPSNMDWMAREILGEEWPH